MLRGSVKIEETDEPVPGLVIALRGGEPASRKGRAAVEDPLGLYPDRLGSTITDPKGAFEIEMTPAGEEEPPPDLLLAVLAPSTVKTADASRDRGARDRSERLLYWTEAPSARGHRSEAFAIRLPEERLEAHGVRPPRRRRAHDVERAAANVVEAEEDGLRLRQALRRGLEPIRRQLGAQRREVTAAAKRFVAPLGATAKAARTRANWVSRGSDTSAAVRHAMEQGLAEVAQASATGSGRLMMALDDTQLAAAGIPEPNRITKVFEEALLGEHPLLEEFKLNHRFFDLARARAEWREQELENLRRAARLLQEQPDLEDPDVDRHVVVEGAGEVLVETD